MDYEKAIPGVTGAVAGGLLAGQLWLPAAAVVIVLAGAVLVRLRFRRNKSIWDRSDRP
jgi:hypothetical protein